MKILLKILLYYETFQLHIWMKNISIVGLKKNQNVIQKHYFVNQRVEDELKESYASRFLVARNFRRARW